MLGAFLREHREKVLGKTVKDTADACQLTESAIYMIERGDRSEVRPQTLLKLVRGYELGSVDELLERANGSSRQEDSASEQPTTGRKRGMRTAST